MGLFQKLQNQIEQRVEAVSHDEAVLKQSEVWTRSVLWGLMATTALGLGWLTFAKTDEIVTAKGKLQPIGSVKEIQMPTGGIAKQILVKDGDRVKAGQLLIQLDAESSQEKQRSLRQSQQLKEQELKTIRTQQRLKKVELQRYLEENGEEIKKLEVTLRLDQDIESRLSSLSKEGAAGELQYLQQRNKVQESVGQLKQTRIERLRQALILEQAIQQLDGQIASLQSELAQIHSQLTDADVNLRYQEVRSPVNGIIFDLKPKSAGYAGQGTETVMKVVPFDKLEAHVEIASDQIGFVHQGMPAEISIDSFPASDFGVLQGTVAQIGSDALPPDQAKQRTDYSYPASIRLDSQQLKVKGGKNLPLQVGMSLNANVKLRKVSYMQMLLGSFRDKADSLRRI